MRVSRLYVPVPLASGAIVPLQGERAHYLRTVLRLKSGVELAVFDGSGGEYAARIGRVEREAICLEIGAHRPTDRESPLETHLGLGIARGERMDFAIQKAVELGVRSITPLFTERCVVRLTGDRRRQRWEHWRGIAVAACEQCGRNRPPQIEEPRPLDEWLATARGLKIFLDPEAPQGLRDLEFAGTEVSLLSGPEGGFGPTERERARAAGFLSLRLGPRILRAETAALAALTAIQAQWGDLAG